MISPRRLNITGFSIPEMIIVAGIMSVLMLAMAALFSNQTRHNRRLTLAGEFNGVTTELRAVLSDLEICNKVFRGMEVKDGPVTLARPAPPISSGSDYGGLKMETVEFTETASACNAPCTNRMFTTLHLKAKLTDVVGLDYIEQRIPLIAEVDSSTPPKIVNCLGAAPSLQQICASFNGTWRADGTCSLPVQVLTGIVHDGDPLPAPPAGYAANQCEVMFSAEDMHHGSQVSVHNGRNHNSNPPDHQDPTYRDTLGDIGTDAHGHDVNMWGDNHYAGTQSYYDRFSQRVRCRYLLSLTAYVDNPTGHHVDFHGDAPDWWPGSCRYLMVCKK